MPRVRTRIFLAVLMLFCIYEPVFCGERQSFLLEPIVVSKSTNRFFNVYSLDSRVINETLFVCGPEALPWAGLDAQPRSLKGGIQADLSLRGSTQQGVLVLLDGQRINDPQTGHHNCDLPFTGEDIERIDVIMGGGTSIFGPDAVGGAVNFRIKRPEEKKRVYKSSIGQFKSHSSLLSITERKNDLGIRASVENEESEGFYTDMEFKKFTAALSAGLNGEEEDFYFNAGYQQKEFGAYDFYTPGNGYLSKEWTRTFLFSSACDLYRQSVTVSPRFLWRRHWDKFMLDKTQVRSSYLNHHRTDIFGPGLYFRKETAFLGEVGLGLEYCREAVVSSNLGDHSRDNHSFFVDQRIDLSPKLSGGWLFRRDDFNGQPGEYTGSVGARYVFNEAASLFCDFSRNVREPSFTEIYYNDPATRGNEGLSAEKAIGVQAGCACQKENMAARTVIFLRKEKDFIDWVKYLPHQEFWRAENITAARVLGIEQSLDMNLDKYCSVKFYYSYVDKHIDDKGCFYKYGFHYARHLASAAIFLDSLSWRPCIFLQYKKKPQRAAWFLTDVYLRKRINSRSIVFCKVSNVFNVEYQEIEGIPQPGRWVSAGLRVEW